MALFAVATASAAQNCAQGANCSKSQTGGWSIGTLNVAPPVRRLKPAIAEALTSKLNGTSGSVWIFYSGDDFQGDRLANDFAQAFSNAGWHADIYGFPGAWNETGLAIESHDEPLGSRTIAAMKAIGLPVQQRPSQGLPFGRKATLSLYLGGGQ